MLITDRDMQIFKFLFEQKIASQEQIARIFFPNATRVTVLQRLAKLVNGGYLRKYGMASGNRMVSVYGLTGQGLTKFQQLYRYKIARPNFKSDSMLHDIGLVDVRRSIESAKMVEDYLTENVLQTCASISNECAFQAGTKLNSDAMVVVRNQSSGIDWLAIELELSEKSGARYEEKLANYYLHSSISAVLYICGSDRIRRLIHQIDKKIGLEFDPKILTCNVRDCHFEETPLVFLNRDGGSFLLE